jgi:hypothetical protein
VVSVDPQRYGLARRQVTLIAGGLAGSTTVSFRFDGVVSTLPVVVE